MKRGGSSSDLASSSGSKRLPSKTSWSATPGIRKQWLTKPALPHSQDFFTIITDYNDTERDVEHDIPIIQRSVRNLASLVHIPISSQSLPSSQSVNLASHSSTIGDERFQSQSEENENLSSKTAEYLFGCIQGTPGVLIAIILNLFLSTSFGLAFFPSDWAFPSDIPRAIGVQMFLFATFISQIVLTRYSQFKGPIGMMMVENIPFMHAICKLTISNASNASISPQTAFATIFYIYAIGSIIVGAFFYILGKFKLGNTIYYFPKHVIVGCIGGIGVFIFQTGMEAATGHAWQWHLASIYSFFFEISIFQLWIVAFLFEILLRILLKTKLNSPILPPFYFICIPPMFYIGLYLFDISTSQAHKDGWFFESTEDVNPLLLWQLMDIRAVDWTIVLSSIPTVMALTIFSIMHVPINIPSLSLSVKQHIDMNNELIAHGISNIVSGLCGGLQNYLCYSNSLLYFKCNGEGKVSGYIVAVLVGIFFLVGPSVVQYVPRCMAGCLLMHVGIDLTKEAIYDTRNDLDSFEYYSVVIITLVMTFYGMTAGLVLGIICAVMTFTLQVSKHVPPIRGMMRASTLKSSKWRCIETSLILQKLTKHILVIQLQGQLFFGNASTIAVDIENILIHENNPNILFIILDFTLVLAIDSSAAEIIANIYHICKKYNVKICYSRPSEEGFPCAVELSERLNKLAGESSGLESHPATPLRDIPTRPGMVVTDDKSMIDGPAIELSRKNKKDNDLENQTMSSETTPIRGYDMSGKNAYPRYNGFISRVDAASPQSKEASTTSRLNGGTSGGYQSLSQTDIDVSIHLKESNPTGSSRNLSSICTGHSITLATHGSRDMQLSNDTSNLDANISRDLFLAQQVHIADSLNDALLWCEDQLLTLTVPTYDMNNPFQYHHNTINTLPEYLQQIYALCPTDIPVEAIDRLLAKFMPREVSYGTILWRQGDISDHAILVARGKLLHKLEEEAGTVEVIEVGHLVGEYGLLNCQRRLGTLLALEDALVYVLTRHKYDELTRDDPYAAFVLARICLGYLSHRVQHVSNRIW